METLWAPWRMAYIDRVNSQAAEAVCIFCAAASGDDLPEMVLHRTPGAVCMLNRYPYNPGHLMVAPRRHGGDLAALAPDELVAVMAEIQLATTVLSQELGCDGFNGGWNQGRVAGAGIDQHLHLHLVPRWSGDTNFMPVLADAKVIPEHLAATEARLRPAFARAAEGAPPHP